MVRAAQSRLNDGKRERAAAQGPRPGAATIADRRPAPAVSRSLAAAIDRSPRLAAQRKTLAAMRAFSSRLASPIQRLMGIEVELSVPVSRTAVAAPAGAVSVEEFLGGGVREGTQIHAPANGFHTEGDHDAIGTEVEAARKQAVRFPTYVGARIPKPAFRVGNLEYVTAPFDEENAAPAPAPGLAQFQATVGAVAADMALQHANALAGIQPVAGTAFRIGVPPVADWNAFTAAHGLPAGFGTGARTAIVNRISNLGELQVTAGIRQDRLERHLFLARSNPALVRATGSPVVAHLLTLGAVNAATTVLGSTAGLTALQSGSAELRSYLSLVIQYAFGHFTYRGAATTVYKNMVAFLSKFPIHRVQEEMDTTIRPRSMAPAVQLALRNALINVVWARVNQPDVVNFWAARGGENGGPLRNWRVWVQMALSGAADAFSQSQLSGRIINPTDHVNSPPIINIGAERPPARAGAGGAHRAGRRHSAGVQAPGSIRARRAVERRQHRDYARPREQRLMTGRGRRPAVTVVGSAAKC
jgi:hypothetical protein